jgi:NAD(P)-dependent dehydrogenase (short-subunit alcohol dehydrogenase family)
MKSASSVEPQRKVVLVTGASSGIGQAIAKHLAARGDRVFGTSRRPLTGSSDGIDWLAMDVDDDASVERGVAAIVDRSGRLDAVVNNAGWALMGAIEDTSIEEARAQMETNFFGVLRVCRAALPIMRAQGAGHIINISSLGGFFGMPFSGIYSASKFAVEGLSESLRFETRRHGIRVVLIEPGDTQSQLPVKRRTVSAAGTAASAYTKTFDAFKAQQAKDEAKAPGPDAIARLVGALVRDPAPRMRYRSGMIDQRVVVPLKRVLPYRLFERILSLAMGV